MSFLRKKLDDLKRPFGKGQKWEKYAPAINAFDTFLFVPNHTTHTGAHIRDAVDLKRTMVTVIIALMHDMHAMGTTRHARACAQSCAGMSVHICACVYRHMHTCACSNNMHVHMHGCACAGACT